MSSAALRGLAPHPGRVIDLPDRTYICLDSKGKRKVSDTPIPRCDRPQRVFVLQEMKIEEIPPTMTEAEREPYVRLHPRLPVSPLFCPPETVTHCDDMVRVSCDAENDGPVFYYDNKTAERLGTCGIWVRNPRCMPDRWRACAVRNRTRHISEEPDPSRPVQ